MLRFPFISSEFWKTIDDPGERIDRVLTDRSYRLGIGVDVDALMQTMQCVLVMTSGHGKYLRIGHVVGSQIELPTVLTDTWNQLTQSPLPSLVAYRQFTSDLADIQIQAIEQVKSKAGKYVDRILFVSIHDAGLWLKDFDGSKIYSSLADAHRIADATGLTVIDGYPANDVIAGGRGGPFSGLPLWLAISDRNAKVADQHRVVLLLNETCEGYLLPASDGLDADLPEIRTIEAPGTRFLSALWTSLMPQQDRQKLVQIFTSGLTAPSLQQQWNQCRDDEQALVKIGIEHALRHKLSPTDVVKTALDFISQSCVDQINRGGRGLAYLGPQPTSNNLRQIYVLGDDDLRRCVVNRMSEDFSQQEILDRTLESIDSDNVRGLIAAMLGMLHVDQMQANIPSITGARQHRVLGKLTPGSPTNWRQLVRDMSDFRPPAMKLRDAI